MTSNRTKPSQAVAATALTSLSSLIAASSAQGAILYFDTSNEFSVGLGTTGSTDWDIDGNPDGLSEAVWIAGGTYLALFDGSADVYGGAFGVLRSFGYVVNMVPGSSNSASRDFFGSGASFIIGSGEIVGSDDPNFSSSIAGYIGFRLAPSFDGDHFKYGWAEITFYDSTNPAGIGATIHRWAYEDDGSSIQVGAIPEPAGTSTGLGILALGAAGLRRWRRRR